MKLEKSVSLMMEISTKARLWHWRTGIAQHHVTYEEFLNQNKVFTDSFVESALGHDIDLDFSQIGVQQSLEKKYSLEASQKEISEFRSHISGLQKELSESSLNAADELIAILDDVTELCSKTLYLLKLK